MNTQFIYEISLAGILLDALGGLYLSYDLLGGKRGPLRILTRAVTYSFLFGFGYRITLGPIFGIVAGIGLGTSLALESAVIAHELTVPWIRSLVFAFYRAIAIGASGWLTFNKSFGLLFGLFGFIGLSFIYLSGIAPVKLYSAIGKPRITKEGLISSAGRAMMIGIAAILAGYLDEIKGDAIRFGVEIGFAVGIVSLVMSIISPYVEWWVDNLPEKKLGAFGAGLVVIGFLLQSIQYLIPLLRHHLL